MIYKHGDKVVKSIDSVFEWLNISTKPDIPDPSEYKERLYQELITDSKPASFSAVEAGNVPAAAYYRKEYWQKEIIMFDGRLLHIWVKV